MKNIMSVENDLPARGWSALGGKVFCVIPAFNEAKNITTVINEVKPIVDKVVVVDDGSTDDTYHLAEACGVDLLKHLINRGQGAALRTGTEYGLAKGADIIVHFDADGQFLSQDIKRIIKPIQDNLFDVVYGSRYLKNQISRELPALKKYLIHPLARAANRIFFKIDLADPQSGLRAMSAQAARRINWRQDRMAHCSEIMFEVKKSKLKVAEIPIVVIYHNFGQSFFGGLKILKDLFIAMMVN